MYKYAFFDLDGTLTQSEFGIMNSILYALQKMNYKVEDKESIKCFIGPPLVQSFMEFCRMSEEDAKQATAYYREHYNGGEMYNAPLYEGIEEMLRELHENGTKLYVVTSKPTFFAQRIVEHFDILKYFVKVIGPELKDINYTKEEMIRQAMCDISPEDPDAVRSSCVMVGDRLYDIEGAVKNQIDSIGVLYGYGSEKELVDAGASFIARDAKEVGAIIRSAEDRT
ncbi:MAG: HAD hydrolase-like protein [Saccharofermentanaceae bacterium]|nr:HAD hydrolase-like protein [Saccharofermentanaceae bacterium]